MLASVLVGMLSIPAASQSLDVSQPVVEDIDNISASGQNPESVQESFGPETYQKTVKTAFEEFRTTIEGDSSRMVESDPETRVEVETSPGIKTFSLDTPEGSIEKTYSSGKVREKVETPEGTLVTERRHGTSKVDFEGSSREKVESKASELRDKLQDRIEEIRERTNTTSTSSSHDIEVEIKPEGNESITLTSSTEVDLDGWNVSDEAGNAYTFEQRTLDAGDSVTLYSGEGEDNESAVYWGRSRIWNDAGDTAYVHNSEGRKVLEKSY
jgi:archaellum component FlaF (FlaF/FlaG flagellin family)